jgi:hypothetical protein
LFPTRLKTGVAARRLTTRWSGHRVPRLRPTRAREKLNYKLSAQALGGAAQLTIVVPQKKCGFEQYLDLRKEKG